MSPCTKVFDSQSPVGHFPPDDSKFSVHILINAKTFKMFKVSQSTGRERHGSGAKKRESERARAAPPTHWRGRHFWGAINNQAKDSKDKARVRVGQKRDRSERGYGCPPRSGVYMWWDIPGARNPPTHPPILSLEAGPTKSSA